MIIVEFDRRYRGYGKYKTMVGGKTFCRIWLGWIAITHTQFHLKEMHDYIAAGNTIWRGK